MKSIFLLLLASTFEFAAAKIYTGFNYGAFWSEQANVKRYADFHHGFELAQNLTNTPVIFDSARLYTCITAGTKDDPTEAFQAAIDTRTNLLLGMWVSPGTTGQPNYVLVDNELAALGKAFGKYGQSLADLIIGLSVRNEDIHRFSSQQAGVGPDNLRLTMQSVREKIKAAPWGNYMEGKPIGHTDTSAYAVMADSEFVGMTAQPYWEGKPIDKANVTFMATLHDTQKRAGNTPVWISEVGWPINGTSIKEAVASADNYERYWNEVGCQVFGKYNTFWFELLQDSTPEQPNWGLLDTKTYQPHIKDLSCGGRSNMTAPAVGTSEPSPSKSGPTDFSTSYVPGSALGSEAPSLPTSIDPRTTRTTQTCTTTVQPTSPATDAAGHAITLFLTTTTIVAATPISNATLPSNNGTTVDKTIACIVVMDLMGDGTFIPVATYAEDVSTCTPPPRFTGSPFTMIDGPAAAPVTTGQRSSFDMYAPSTTSKPMTTPTAVQSDGPTCMTAVGVAYDVLITNGETHTGRLTASCPPVEPTALISTVAAPIAPESSAVTAVSTTAPPTSSSLISIPSPFQNSSSPTTFSIVTVPATPSQPPLAPAPPHSTSQVPSTSLIFSHSLALSMFLPSPTSKPWIMPPYGGALPNSILPPAVVTPPPTPPPFCPDGALICAPAFSGGWFAEMTDGVANVVMRDGRPVQCTPDVSTGACTWAEVATSPSSACAKEGDTICLRIGVQAVIKDAVPVLVSPRVACAPPLVRVRACPPTSALPGLTLPASSSPVSAPPSPSAPGINSVLSILSEAREKLRHTTWASPIPAASASASPRASTSMRMSPGAVVA